LSSSKCKPNGDAHQECTSAIPSPLCTPYRSPDFCPLDESFPLLIQQRSRSILADPDAARSEGYFFQDLEDKIKAYIFSAGTAKVRAPQIYHCTSDVPDGLNGFNPPPSNEGFVIRATDLHSSNGVYVFPNGFGGIELLSNTNMNLADVQTSLATLNAEKVIIEEYIEAEGTGTLPTEYKVHVFDGEIGSINIVHNRGGSCACWAEVDKDWNRLDQWGCFTPSGTELEPDGECHAIDFNTGRNKAYPMKGLDLCGEIEKPADCLIADIVAVAQDVSKRIGAYVRVDMFVAQNNEIIVQEYTTNHMAGLRHCSARMENGCVNSCFLGEMWQAAGGNAKYGGPSTGVPSDIATANTLGDTALCDYAISI
jgi:hypothetical protein